MIHLSTHYTYDAVKVILWLPLIFFQVLNLFLIYLAQNEFKVVRKVNKGNCRKCVFEETVLHY